jgi:hypothetical protein
VNRNRGRLHRWGRLGLASLALAGALPLLARAADHRDGPVFGPPGLTITNSRRDINDVYIFQSPANADNTVIVMTLSPFSTATTPNTFDPTCAFEFKIDNTGDFIEDITFRITFSAADAQGIQTVTLRGLPSTKFPANGGILARGNTRTNLPVAGGGMFRAAEQDDPFFFDAVGLNMLLNGLPNGQVYPRPVNNGGTPPPNGFASNFFGPNVNTLAITLEIPRLALQSSPTNSVIRFWGRSEVGGRQLDRMGLPALNTALVPPIPRGSNPAIQPLRGDLRNAYNAGLPRNDVRDFRPHFVTTLQGFPYMRTAADANAIAGVLLPDVLTFDTTSNHGFEGVVNGNLVLNGRRLRDAVIHVELGILTNGAITTDNVDDDNGMRITDGTNGTTAAFPYIGPPNAMPTGLNPPPPP